MKLFFLLTSAIFLMIVLAFLAGCKSPASAEVSDPLRACKWVGDSGGCSFSYPYTCDNSSLCFNTMTGCKNSSGCD